MPQINGTRMFAMQHVTKNQNNKRSHATFFSKLYLSMHWKIRRLPAPSSLVPLLTHESKDKACKEYLPKYACKYIKAPTTTLISNNHCHYRKVSSIGKATVK